MRSLVTSTFLYACDSWILTAELQRKIQAMEMGCYHKLLRISYKHHVTDEDVRAKIQRATGPHEDLLTIVKRRKLKCCLIRSGQNHLARHSERGGGEETRQTDKEVGRQHQEMDRPGVCQVPEQWRTGKIEEEKKLVAKSSVVPQRPSRLRNR